MRRRGGWIVWLVIVAAIAVLLLAWQYVGFRLSTRALPAGMTVAGLPVAGMKPDEVLNRLEVAFATPIAVFYEGERLSLPPEAVEFRYDADKTAVALNAMWEARRGWKGFVAHILRREKAAVALPVAVSYSAGRLDEYLARIAAQYDRPPQAVMAIPGSLTFVASRPGRKLDIAASRARLAAALVSAVEREVALVVQTEPPPPSNLTVLQPVIQSLLEGHHGLTAGIFIKDLQTGEEWAINGDVAYSGMSLLKIAIMEETYRLLDPPIPAEVTGWLSSTMGPADSHPAADLLLSAVIGAGDSEQGAINLTTSMHRLGLLSTFMAASYAAETPPVAIVTPANSRPDLITTPDSRMQTTPQEIGLLLEMIYQCAYGGGALMVVYPGSLTPAECNQMIAWLSTNRIDSLIEAGLPVNTVVAHKHGFSGDTHADAALVLSPGGDFVLVVFLHRPQWLPWEESAPLVADVAAATYNYFNPAQ